MYGWGCGRFLGVVSYTASPWLVLYSTRLFQPSDCLILEWLYQRMYSPARPPASSHVRSSQCPEMHGPGSSYDRRTPRPRRCPGCTPSRPWTGPGRTGSSGPAIPDTGNGIRGRRETTGRSSARSVAVARTRHRVAPVPRSATSRPCAPRPCRRSSRSSGKGRPCRHGP